MPWEIWRIWQSGRATLQEIEEHWSITDVAMALAVLDYEMDCEIESYNRQMKAKK